MSAITEETRLESYESIYPMIGERQEQCLNGLKELHRATANELAMHLYEKGITPLFSRNYVHPRLNELVNLGVVHIVGKKFDHITKRRCAIYSLA